ncbi:MAG TPA: hypothetical protein VHL31_18045 [Geminicoccus sp.]|uniref:hypothetical protein n=1 Tax=Geminicoccus sp. TaxID=2024832 RepID=UPI002E30B4A9|nr:hypothetical protein [Geminicoccus sp.]HEX2528190.1 hypothetical protein [Geminicoccus sp.]
MVECPAAADRLKACFDKALSACRNGFMVVMPADALEPDGGIDTEARMVARCAP